MFPSISDHDLAILNLPILYPIVDLEHADMIITYNNYFT